MKAFRRLSILIALGVSAVAAQAQPPAAIEAGRASRQQSQAIMRQSGDRVEKRRRAFEQRMKQRNEADQRMQQGASRLRAQRSQGRRVGPATPPSVAVAVEDSLTTRLPIQSNDPATSDAQNVTTHSAEAMTAAPAEAVPLARAASPSGPIRELIDGLPIEIRRAAVEKLQTMSAQERLRLRREMEAAPEPDRAARLMKALGIRGSATPDRMTTVAQAVRRSNPALEPYLSPPRGTPYVVPPADPKERGFRATALGALPRTGRPAPDFSLQMLDGKSVSGESFRGRPLVLVFGSITCPVFRGNIPALNRLADAMADRAAFLIIYTLEAHPHDSTSPYFDGVWVPEKNVRDGVLKPQPTDMAGRTALARETIEKHGLRLPVAVDTMDNAIWQAFGARPNSAFVIDATGRVAVAQEWAEPEQLREALEQQAGAP